ncbi:MAG: four helix bundle protein, partial [Pseudomonadota bacterium]|nr:four helix bundle protein [Pseudomonadota bacterium]
MNVEFLIDEFAALTLVCFTGVVNVIREKSYDFSVRIVRMVQYLQREHHEVVLSKQVLRSGTSIGANIEEAQAGQSRNDFVVKMCVSPKEAHETHYWIRLLRDTGYLTPGVATSIEKDCLELRRFLEIYIPACLSFRPSSALRKRLHSSTMRPFPRLADERKSC